VGLIGDEFDLAIAAQQDGSNAFLAGVEAPVAAGVDPPQARAGRDPSDPVYVKLRSYGFTFFSAASAAWRTCSLGSSLLMDWSSWREEASNSAMAWTADSRTASEEW